MIDLAIDTKDKNWLDKLSNQLKKLEQQENKIDNEKFYNNELDYDYYICQTDCNNKKTLIVVEDKIYSSIPNKNILYKTNYFVKLNINKEYKKGEKIHKSELEVFEEESEYLFGYFEGQLDYIEAVSEFINNKDKIIKIQEQKENLLQQQIDLLKSEINILHNDYFSRKDGLFGLIKKIFIKD